MALGLNSAGYELIHRDSTTLTFQRSIKERLTIDLEKRGKGNTTTVIYGRVSRKDPQAHRKAQLLRIA